MTTPADKPYEIEELVITCMDHRFQAPVKKILKDKHNIDIDNVDRLSIGGPSKAVADGTLIPSLRIAFEKHHIRSVFLFDHIDCGGFGGLQAFANDENKEARAHFDSLSHAQEVINRELPDLRVVSYVVGLDGEPLGR